MSASGFKRTAGSSPPEDCAGDSTGRAARVKSKRTLVIFISVSRDRQSHHDVSAGISRKEFDVAFARVVDFNFRHIAVATE